MQHGRLAFETLEAVRAEAPLVHNITSYTAMDLSAGALLAVGASPAMFHAEEEVDEFVALSQALVVNLGTLSPAWVRSMGRALHRANELGIPSVLDPVGCGTTRYRTEVANGLARARPTVIRGNAAEIRALAGLAHATARGVDSEEDGTDAVEAARRLAHSTGAIVAVTGAIDRITDGDEVLEVHNGHLLMTRVSAVGCSLSAVVGAFVAVQDDTLLAVAHAVGVVCVSGEIAAETSDGPGSFRGAFLDTLHSLDAATLERKLRIRIANP